MKWWDVLQFALGSLRGSRARTLLMMLAMSIGVAAVVILTALGDGARQVHANYHIPISNTASGLLVMEPGA